MTDMQVNYIHHCGDDLTTVNAARVSFAKESWWVELENSVRDLPDKDKRLINYLAKHKHKSPFNHAFVSFRVKAPVFVARQLVKHEYLTWNEVSRRYVDDEPEFYMPDHWRKRAENVKQGSSGEVVADFGGLWDYEGPISEHVEEANHDARILYNDMIEAGVCPEQARMVLPQSMMTQWWWSGTLGAWAKMANLRLDDHAQQETRVVAQRVAGRMAALFPVSWDALMRHPIL